MDTQTEVTLLAQAVDIVTLAAKLSSLGQHVGAAGFLVIVSTPRVRVRMEVIPRTRGCTYGTGREVGREISSSHGSGAGKGDDRGESGLHFESRDNGVI